MAPTKSTPFEMTTVLPQDSGPDNVRALRNPSHGQYTLEGRRGTSVKDQKSLRSALRCSNGSGFADSTRKISFFMRAPGSKGSTRWSGGSIGSMTARSLSQRTRATATGTPRFFECG
jgi:hypothetical protein